VLVDERGKSYAAFLIEFLGAARIVLRYAQERNVVAAIAFEQALKKRKSELANRAGNFEESQNNRASFQKCVSEYSLPSRAFNEKPGAD